MLYNNAGHQEDTDAIFVSSTIAETLLMLYRDFLVWILMVLYA